MQIEFQCKQCSGFITAEQEQKGHQFECQLCGFEQKVPLQGTIDVGNVLEDHLIQEEIGHGSMGRVFLASHLLMNRQVALKTISPKVRQDADAVDQFILELQMGAQLSHPNIVTVYTAGYTGGVYYISMQYIDGFDMNERIDTNGPMEEKEALAVISTVADAMSYAWNDFRMIHRDLKPENIRVSTRGEIMIMDFGLAKTRTMDSVADEGLVIGTPDFMSPEQGEARLDIDFRADMYSLGIVLVYLLTSKRPFKADKPLDVVAMHINKPLPSIEEMNPDVRVSNSVKNLIQVMTAKDRDERFTSWEEVSEAVDRTLVSLSKPKKKNGAKKGNALSTKTIRVAVPSNVGSVRRRRSRSSSNPFGMLLVIFIILAVVLFGVYLKMTGKILVP
jgi:serine/threonine protein kinase